MKNSIVYKGERIARGSHAYELWEAKNFQALDKHMSKVHREAVDRGEIRQRDLYEEVKALVNEGFKQGKLTIITGGGCSHKSMFAAKMADQIIGLEVANQQRRSAQLRVEMVKARALPGDSGLTVGEIHSAPIIDPDTPNP